MKSSNSRKTGSSRRAKRQRKRKRRKRADHRTSIATAATRSTEAALGQKLKALRQQQGLTINGFVELLKTEHNLQLSQPTIAAWERSTRTPPVGALPILANALHCNLIDLFVAPEQPEQTNGDV